MVRGAKSFSVLGIGVLLSACSSIILEKADFNKNDASQARLELALGYLNVGDFTQGKRNLDKALAYAPKNAMVFAVYAYFYQLQGNNGDAERFYQQALKLDGKRGEIKHNYAIFLCEIGKYQDAFQQFELALASQDYYYQKDTYKNIILCAKQAQDHTTAEKYHHLLTRFP